MSNAPEPDAPASAEGDPRPVRLQRLLPAGGAIGPDQLIDELGLWERPRTPPPRPRVLLNMVATADGRATLGGRSGTISDAADRAMFHALRAPMDAVLVGAGTIRTERYGRLIGEEWRRRERTGRGLPAEPLACIVSGRLGLDVEIPLLASPESRVILITASAASLPGARAEIGYIRSEGGQLDLASALAELASRHGVTRVLCEGGPHLAREMLAAGLIDELFLSVAPLLAGGEPSGGEALRILAGAELDSRVPLELAGVLRGGSMLFLRYLVSAGENASTASPS
jgi:riboflavin biosynthesis pyrimidine reductase